jgi:hypothetical protein
VRPISSASARNEPPTAYSSATNAISRAALPAVPRQKNPLS